MSRPAEDIINDLREVGCLLDVADGIAFQLEGPRQTEALRKGLPQLQALSRLSRLRLDGLLDELEGSV